MFISVIREGRKWEDLFAFILVVPVFVTGITIAVLYWTKTITDGELFSYLGNAAPWCAGAVGLIAALRSNGKGQTGAYILLLLCSITLFAFCLWPAFSDTVRACLMQWQGVVALIEQVAG